MRRKHTYLLTIFPSEEHEPALHGRIEFISNGMSYTFNNLAELERLIEGSIRAEQNSPSAPQIRDLNSAYQTRSNAYPGHCDEEG